MNNSLIPSASVATTMLRIACWLFPLLPAIPQLQAQVVSTDTKVETSTAGVGVSWISTLPKHVQDSILWSATYESGNLDEWSIPTSQDPGGGVLNTDPENVTAAATTQVVHSGRYAAETTIRNAYKARGNKAVRLMRWATNAYDQGGTELPLEAYYSTWMYVPHDYDPTKRAPWDPGDGGWWIVFQFKSHDESNVSQPIWNLNILRDERSQELHFYLYSPINDKQSWQQTKPVAIPIRRWFHVQAFYRCRSDRTGEITIWMDGQKILEANRVRTSLHRGNENVVWGIGNYTDHVQGGPKPGEATLFFDDSAISSQVITLPEQRTR